MLNTINLPIETFKSIINIDDKNVLVSVESIMNFLKNNTDKSIRSMYTIPDVINKELVFNHDISYITKLTKQNITNTNDIKYYEIIVKFYNEKEITFIFPGYVKLFSKTAKNFIPVEFIKKTDVLVDYQGYNIYVLANNFVNFEPTEYYNIQINSNTENAPFYVNGILSYVYYNNFQKLEENHE